MTIPIYDASPQYQLLKDEIGQAIQQVLSHGQFILGPEVQKFEQEAAKYLGTKHAIGVNSGTDALVIALRALGIGAGDEVITTSLSFFATAESISNVGAKPVFVDIDETTFNIDADKIEAAITPQTEAILPVHLFGQPAQMARIMHIAEKHDLKVIEDCAQSFGACYGGNCIDCDGEDCKDSIRSNISGKQTGAIGDCGTYSFFPTKNLGGIGDGGMIVTDDDEVARKAKMLRVHGAEKKYQNEMLGYNSRLDTIQAAVLCIKLTHIDDFNTQRRKVAQRYNSMLGPISDLILPKIVEGHVFHQYTVRVKDGNRDDLQHFLKSEGISTKIYFPIPQNELPVYKNHPKLPVSHQLSKQVLSLPMWPHLSKGIQEKIIEKISLFFQS
jgi:dTDP-4-amino-4,6-dideoxygalactose transaminase